MGGPCMDRRVPHALRVRLSELSEGQESESPTVKDGSTRVHSCAALVHSTPTPTALLKNRPGPQTMDTDVSDSNTFRHLMFDAAKFCLDAALHDVKFCSSIPHSSPTAPPVPNSAHTPVCTAYAIHQSRPPAARPRPSQPGAACWRARTWIHCYRPWIHRYRPKPRSRHRDPDISTACRWASCPRSHSSCCSSSRRCPGSWSWWW